MSQETYRYCLSKNDEDIVKHYTDKPLSENARKTLIILSEVFGGLHHLDSDQLKHFNYQSDRYNEYLVGGSLATFDGMELTCLVVACHDMAVRLEISPASLADKDELEYDHFLKAYRKELVDEAMSEFNITEDTATFSRPYLRLFFHQRVRDGDYSKRHPTLEDSTKGFRAGTKRYA